MAPQVEDRLLAGQVNLLQGKLVVVEQGVDHYQSVPVTGDTCQQSTDRIRTAAPKSRGSHVQRVLDRPISSREVLVTRATDEVRGSRDCPARPMPAPGMRKAASATEAASAIGPDRGMGIVNPGRGLSRRSRCCRGRPRRPCRPRTGHAPSHRSGRPRRRRR
jgi:hypothetical protein